MPQPWSDDAIRHLLDSDTCPRCGVDGLLERRCLNCGADLRGEIAGELWTASVAAADALRTRQAVLDRVPVTPITAPVPVVAAPPEAVSAAAAASAAASHPAPPAEPERASATVQSVLAVAGAGLFAVAAIVFTFINPVLTDDVLRSVIVGVVTLIFLGGAWLLARRSLQFSAEAVGALGMVFVALDVYAISELARPPVSPWLFAAVGTLVSALLMVAFGIRARIRTWLFLALLGLATVPAMFGYAGVAGDRWGWTAILGHLGVAFAVPALLQVLGRLGERFGGALRAERLALGVLQGLAVISIIVFQLRSTAAPTPTLHWLGIAGVLAALAVLSVPSARHLVPQLWSFLAGAFATAAVTALPFALDLHAGEWLLALLPAAAAVAVVALAALPTPRGMERPALTAGTLTIGAAALVSSVTAALLLVLLRLIDVARVPNLQADELFGGQAEQSIVVGLLAAAAGLAVFAVLGSRRAGAFTIGMRTAALTAVSVAVLGALAFASWTAWLPVTRVAIAIGLALVVALVGWLVPRVRRSSLAIRVPAIAGAHLLLVQGAILSWEDDAITVLAGVAAVAVLIPLALSIRVADRPVHVGAGYAYALLIFAHGLDLTDQFSTAALLALTTVLGAAGAIAVTLVPRVRAPAWYAVLVVTAVPFLIGVGVVVAERSGWAALASGVIFLLALTLLLTRRPGLGVPLRAIAAGLLVPTVAVVVTNLAAEFLEQSGSPIALPVIAVLVAGVLPSTALIRSALIRNGLPDREAGVARIAIEGSALLTGAIAVVLALVRQAAGLDTSVLVLLILGIGALATAIWAKRRYAWWVAFGSFTAALWCVWALQGITLVEPYLLPPALALALIGVIITVRGGRGAARQAVALYTVGIAVSVAPVLAILAATGSGPRDAIPWRAIALLAAAWVLLLIGALLSRVSRLRVLQLPTLVVVIAAGSAGAIQAVRYGVRADEIAVEPYGRMLVCLALGLAGAIAAAAAARVILDSAAQDSAKQGSRLASTRWMYAPATLFVALSAVALRPGHLDWPAIWTMWALMLAFLVFVVVIVVRARRAPTTLPPVWFVWGLAFVIAVVGWSARDLRVEAFSVPLGLFLLAAGVLGMRGVADSARPAVPTLNTWPIGPRASWPLLGPGIVVLFLASVLATGTDPRIERAVGVIVVALLAILIGAQWKLRAPFLLGIIVLPIENIVVFASQLLRGNNTMPWWITLAVVGAVLLILAVTYERRSGADNSVTARMRDLR